MESSNDEHEPLLPLGIQQTNGSPQTSEQPNASGVNAARALSCHLNTTVKITGLVLLLGILLLSVADLFAYIYCYFGKQDYFLRFLSHMCYWPSMISVQMITFFAFIFWVKNGCATQEGTISWLNLLKDIDLLKKEDFCNPMFLVYLITPTVHVMLKIIYISHLNNECLNWTIAFFTISDIVGAFYFSMFWFYLYLHRISLEEKSTLPDNTTELNDDNVNTQLSKVREFFKEYYQLRSMIPWLYLNLFSATVGISVLFTWNYNQVIMMSDLIPDVSTVSPVDLRKDLICRYSCDEISFLSGGSIRLWYDFWVLWRHLLTAVLPYCSANGLEIKHIWDNFKMNLCLRFYSKENRDNFKCLMDVVKHLHPESTITIVAFFIPLVALSAGLLSGQSSTF